MSHMLQTVPEDFCGFQSARENSLQHDCDKRYTGRCGDGTPCEAPAEALNAPTKKSVWIGRRPEARQG
jgi:hypothetical protein